jgi:hypothetical protein
MVSNKLYSTHHSLNSRSTEASGIDLSIYRDYLLAELYVARNALVVDLEPIVHSFFIVPFDSTHARTPLDRHLSLMMMQPSI